MNWNNNFIDYKKYNTNISPSYFSDGTYDVLMESRPTIFLVENSRYLPRGRTGRRDPKS